MKIEPHKFYKTRDGRKARVYAVDGDRDYPIHGAVLNGPIWELTSWTAAAQFNATCEGSSRDLVSEWVEPRTGTFWVNIYPNGFVGGIAETREQADDNDSVFPTNRTACIKINWTEGEGLNAEG